ncbi:MAG: hypothetical protein ACOY46_13005 [Bacillota bacterium]
MKNVNAKENPALETVAQFLESVKNGDSKAFWDILDKRGQGYFLGLWFYALETMNVQTIINLTSEKEFLDGVLGPIMAALKESIGDLLESPDFGEFRYHTPQCASIKVTPSGKSSAENNEEDDFIPLVLELNDANDDETLTCWKIDTLQCFQLSKGIH